MSDQQNKQRRNRASRGGSFRPGTGPQRKIQPGPCPDSLDALNADFNAIRAPYNFVPLSRWVHRPKKGSQASLDLPFSDGASGAIPFTLVAETPILVGGEQEKHENAAGEVRFSQAPDGTFLIPGSALRGMLRSVIEIAGFGRMHQVDDTRYGLRDITRADTPYAQRVNSSDIRAGFLRRSPSGRELVPCRFAKLSHADLERWWGERTPIFRGGTGVRKKYDLWARFCRDRGIADPLRISCTIEGAPGQEQVRSLSGPTLSYPVLTGQINDRDHNRNAKQHDFVFYDRDESAALPVTDEDWRAFLLIHGDRDRESRGDGNAMRPSWPDYWRGRFDKGEEIPVFWLDARAHLEGRKRVRIGLARMPKLAWDWSIYQLIGHTDEEHLHGPEQGGEYDLADLLFGALGGDRSGAPDPRRTLKGRVSVGHALAEPANGRQPLPERHGPTILNAPKPTYFPNYLRQPAGPDWRLEPDREYAGYIETQQNQNPEIRGFKRYPARPQAAVQPLTPEQQQGSQKVAKVLHPLPAGTRFSGRIVFHNLRPAELGALVWALTWGDSPGLRHSLGMGKPFGFGQVHFDIDWSLSRVVQNKALKAGPSPVDRTSACAAMEEHMEAAYENSGLPGTWRDSPQVRSLLAMADPARAADFPAELRHMRLQRCIDPARNRPGAYNEFVWAKQKRLVLADYDAQASMASRSHVSPRRSSGGPPSERRSASAGRPAAAPRPAIDNAWLKAKVDEIRNATHAPEDDVIGGKLLAAAWQQIPEPEEKAAVLAAIKALWDAKGWWDDPPGKGKRKVKAMYQPD